MINPHTPDKMPDWELIPEENRNAFQNIAAQTNGIATVGNAITYIGYSLTNSGLSDVEHGYSLAESGVLDLAELMTQKGNRKNRVGRVLDIVDGIAADKTGTKSPLGEKIDAFADKILMLKALRTLHRTNSAPKSTIGAYLILGSVNAVSALEAKRKGKEIHTSKAGKIATVLAWHSITDSIAITALSYKNEDKKKISGLEKRAKVTTALAIGLGMYATYGYVKQAFSKEASEDLEQQDSQYVESEGNNCNPDDDQQNKLAPRD